MKEYLAFCERFGFDPKSQKSFRIYCAGLWPWQIAAITLEMLKMLEMKV